MATIQHSIDIKAPVHLLFNQLAQFEDYPSFMQDVEVVMQVDETHLHWTTRMANRPVEWDAEISEQEIDRCIAWHNTSGPTNSGKIEVQPIGPDTSRLTFTLRAEPQQVPGSMAGNHEDEMAQRLLQDLARLKALVESQRAEADAPVQHRTADGADGQGSGLARSSGQSGNSPAGSSSYAAGSEGFSGDEDPSSPVVGARHAAAEQGNESAGSASGKQPGAAPAAPRSRSNAPVRHLGQMPQDTTAQHHGGSPSSDAMGNPMEPKRQD